MAREVKVYLEGLSLPRPGKLLVLAIEPNGEVKRCAGAGSWPVGTAIEIQAVGRCVDVDRMERELSECVQGPIRGYPHEWNTWGPVFDCLDKQPPVFPANKEADEPVICTEASPASLGRYGKGREETERAYFAVSVKHSAHKWRFGKPLTLWGYKRTADGEARCFGGYTLNPDCAELYAPGDFEGHGYTADVVKPDPVKLGQDFCRKYRDFDTVLVPAKDISDYWRLCGLLPAADEETAQ